MTYRACWPDSDPEDWIEVDAFDAEDAAEKAVEHICNVDSDSYNSFKETGELIIVRCPAGKLSTFRVTVEFEPSFSARREGK